MSLSMELFMDGLVSVNSLTQKKGNVLIIFIVKMIKVILYLMIMARYTIISKMTIKVELLRLCI